MPEGLLAEVEAACGSGPRGSGQGAAAVDRERRGRHQSRVICNGKREGLYSIFVL